MIFGHYFNDFHILRTKLRRNKGINPTDNWVKNPKDLKGNDFQDWFDTTSSEENSIEQAEKDFNNRIIEGIEDIKFKNSCEIGFGGGRLLYQASKFFNDAYGIDIHDNFQETSNFLKRNKVENFHLLNFDERNNLPKIDLFYSFIVIQHFEKLEVLKSYIELIHSKLSSGGYAVLWYGKLSTSLWGDYYEVPTSNFRKRECSLYIRPCFMEELCSNFQIIESSPKHPKSVETKKGQSMQAKIILRKI